MAKSKLKSKEDYLTIRKTIALMAQDIDIFLLRENDQITDKDKLYTKEEIRKQLMSSVKQTIKVLKLCNIDIDKTLKFKDLNSQLICESGVLLRQNN